MIVIKSQKLRKTIKITVPFVLFPILAVTGALLDGGKRYVFFSILAAVFALLLFFAGFEKKKIGSRRLIIVAVMIALSVAGRFIPIFKPVTALVVITAVYFGAEAGFATGALSAFVSNFYFGQGPWTPFQMLALGLIGLFAGVFAQKLKKSRVLLVVYGVLSGVLYSLVMDVWTVLWYDGGLTPALYLSAILTAMPFTLLYAFSNALFLWISAKPFYEKFERIKLKYGI